MSRNRKKAKTHVAFGFMLAGVAIGAAAALATVMRQKQREQVYHEAELKAMHELDDIMAENECGCVSCDCMEDCCADEQIDIFEEDDQPAARGDEEE